ncbi:MAG: 4-hydroxybutyryl-CoA dehydratase [Deltaproteobacteria bacterium]|nr:4-hydroxybutyryl-CoA dehydratase [Deltaproteobacteria bacterium]MBW2084670.1 4-hydroxybutyryl-CoA dehydratase [Deltaproteobacteria bacterium]
MGLRTVEEFKESLKDGRQVYIFGEKIEDITTHPILKISVETAAGDYQLTHSDDPAVRDLFVMPHPETGEPMSRYFEPPHTPEDLEKRLQMIGDSIRITGGLPFGKDIGTDAMYAIMTTAKEIGKPEYGERAGNYLEHLRKNDLNLCGAITCVKGDRGQTPAKQTHPDYYLRVVDKNKDGIIVKGAKIHITGAPVANDLLVLPTRQMRENEPEYAVAFSIPANAPGITFICRPSRGERTPSEFPLGRPVRGLVEAMIVFDNVLVPWDRVFMCGEWEHSMRIAYNFATYHRFTAVSYKIPAVELMAGVAVAMAEMNGIETKGHIRGKLMEVAAYVETLKALATAAMKSPVMYGDIAVPNPLITNMGKLHFASHYHEILRIIQDISGGIITTMPTFQDWENPDLHDYLEYYLGASPRYTSLERMKMIQLTHDMVCSAGSAHMEVVTMHGEGSMEAQRMMILMESPLQEYKKGALAAAGIELK